MSTAKEKETATNVNTKVQKMREAHLVNLEYPPSSSPRDGESSTADDSVNIVGFVSLFVCISILIKSSVSDCLYQLFACRFALDCTMYFWCLCDIFELAFVGKSQPFWFCNLAIENTIVFCAQSTHARMQAKMLVVIHTYRGRYPTESKTIFSGTFQNSLHSCRSPSSLILYKASMPSFSPSSFSPLPPPPYLRLRAALPLAPPPPPPSAFEVAAPRGRRYVAPTALQCLPHKSKPMLLIP